MGLREYVIKRIVFSLILVVFVVSLNFVIFDLLPGRPEEVFVQPGMKREQIDALIKLWELDKPAWERFVKMFYNLMTGNFLNTYSFLSQAPISAEINSRIANTLLLVGTSTILSIIIGIALGAICAYKRGGKLDSGLVTSSLVLFSFPSFWLGMLFILIFGIQLGWFPTAHPFPPEWASIYADFGGYPPPFASATIPGIGLTLTIPSVVEIAGRLRHLALPVTVLTIFQYGGWLLLARASILECITEDYVLTARAKGIKERIILFKHVLRNAALPLITNIAISMGFMLSGAIITEGVFAYRGLGAWVWEAVQVKDFPVLQSMFFIIGVSVIAANFIADLLYGLIDPRIKYG